MSHCTPVARKPICLEFTPPVIDFGAGVVSFFWGGIPPKDVWNKHWVLVVDMTTQLNTMILQVRLYTN